MKKKILMLLRKTLQSCQRSGSLPLEDSPPISVEYPKAKGHGDYATNVAMVLASRIRRNAREIGKTLLDHLADEEKIVKSAEVAGPGFINFRLTDESWRRSLLDILRQGPRYGDSDIGNCKRVLVEFVSANPTGPLHVGHGRGAVIGDVLANLLRKAGFQVEREYYVNDLGSQMLTLGRSVYLRMLQVRGEQITFSAECYQGDYIIEIARELYRSRGERILGLSEEEAFQQCSTYAKEVILRGIRKDLDDFGIRFDRWFFETSLAASGQIDETITDFHKQGTIYENDGAWWFRTTQYGDEKDRVVRRANGEYTYFASDIAYHRDKMKRGYQELINIWGADHHGYLQRIRAVIQALGGEKEVFQVILVQLVSLLRDGVPVSMSTRAGSFVTLKEVRDEVGADAARFFFLMRRANSPLDFDLELAKKTSNENPVYYVQYAHARICSIFLQSKERGIEVPPLSEELLGHLGLPEEMEIIRQLAIFPEFIEECATSREPHRITSYLQELAGLFHSYYNHHRVLSEDWTLSGARLGLVSAIQIVLRSGLELMGISAPEAM